MIEKVMIEKDALQSLIKKQFNLKMQIGSGQLSKNHLLKQVRKEIARHKTLCRQAELGVSK